MTKSVYLRLPPYGLFALLVALLLATPTTALANEPPTYTVVGLQTGPNHPKRPGQVIATDPDGDPVTIDFISAVHLMHYRVLELDEGFIVAEYANFSPSNTGNTNFVFELSDGVNTVIARIESNRFSEVFCTVDLALPYAKSDYLRLVPAVLVGGINLIDVYVAFVKKDLQRAMDFMAPHYQHWHRRQQQGLASEVDLNLFMRSMNVVTQLVHDPGFRGEILKLPPGEYGGSTRCIENQ